MGAIGAAALAEALTRAFGALPEAGELQAVPRTQIQELGQRIVVDLDVPQSVIRFGMAGIHVAGIQGQGPGGPFAGFRGVRGFQGLEGQVLGLFQGIAPGFLAYVIKRAALPGVEEPLKVLGIRESPLGLETVQGPQQALGVEGAHGAARCGLGHGAAPGGESPG